MSIKVTDEWDDLFGVFEDKVEAFDSIVEEMGWVVQEVNLPTGCTDETMVAVYGNDVECWWDGHDWMNDEPVPVSLAEFNEEFSQWQPGRISIYAYEEQ